MTQKMLPLYTEDQFRVALIKVLEKDYYDFIKSNPERANRAIIRIFLERLDRKNEYKHAVEVIRHVTQVLNEDGIYRFAERTAETIYRQKLHFANACGRSVYAFNNVSPADRAEFLERGWIKDTGFVTFKGVRYAQTGKA